MHKLLSDRYSRAWLRFFAAIIRCGGVVFVSYWICLPAQAVVPFVQLFPHELAWSSFCLSGRPFGSGYVGPHPVAPSGTMSITQSIYMFQMSNSINCLDGTGRWFDSQFVPAEMQRREFVDDPSLSGDLEVKFTSRAMVTWTKASGCSTNIGQSVDQVFFDTTIAQKNGSVIVPTNYPPQNACLAGCNVQRDYVFTGITAYVSPGQTEVGNGLFLLFGVTVLPGECVGSTANLGSYPSVPVMLAEDVEPAPQACTDENNDGVDDVGGQACIPVCLDENDDGIDDITGRPCGERALEHLAEREEIAAMKDVFERFTAGDANPEEVAASGGGLFAIPVGLLGTLAPATECSISLDIPILLQWMGDARNVTAFCSVKNQIDPVLNFALYALVFFVAMKLFYKPKG